VRRSRGWSVWPVVLTIGLLTPCDGFFTNEPLVFVTARVLNMRGRASTSGAVVDRLERGDELAVLEQGETWMRVRTDRDVIGWVHGGYVGTRR
jgi:hypothetical protein